MCVAADSEAFAPLPASGTSGSRFLKLVESNEFLFEPSLTRLLRAYAVPSFQNARSAVWVYELLFPIHLPITQSAATAFPAETSTATLRQHAEPEKHTAERWLLLPLSNKA